MFENILNKSAVINKKQFSACKQEWITSGGRVTNLCVNHTTHNVTPPFMKFGAAPNPERRRQTFGAGAKVLEPAPAPNLA